MQRTAYNEIGFHLFGNAQDNTARVAFLYPYRDLISDAMESVAHLSPCVFDKFFIGPEGRRKPEPLHSTQ